jgi:hypothetical protein
LRAVLHQAGAGALSELLQFEAPAPDQRQLPCACGHQAQYQELRSRPVLTVVGWARMKRPWYLCAHCHEGQFPADVELDIENQQSGMFWTVRGANAIIALRCCYLNGRFEGYWGVAPGLLIPTSMSPAR